jgi:iron complex transport system substrate-binding protein
MLQLLSRALFTLLFGLAMSAGTPPYAHGETRPQRIVSLNLCTDQLLLALADRDQIASLSPLVHDRSISFLADEARAFPVNQGRGEEVLFSAADLVLAGRYDPNARLTLMEGQGLDVMVLDPWESLDEGRDQIRSLARRLGNPHRGEALIGEIDSAVARAEGIVPTGRSIMIYHRRGWVPSARSLTNEILSGMGFTLHQEKLGLSQGGVARLENIVETPPDYALMDDVLGASVDQGSALLGHPALGKAIPPERRLVVPGALLICGGPSTPAAIDALAEQVRAKVR